MGQNSTSEAAAAEPVGSGPVGPGLTPWVLDGEWWHTAAQVGPEACLEGSDRPLTGVLFAYLDVVTASPPSGTMNPTVDLQIRLFSPPRQGIIRFKARTLRLGRTLYVGEAELRQDDEDQALGVGLATFVNKPIVYPEPPELPDPTDTDSPHPTAGNKEGYRRLTGVRRLGPGQLELDSDMMNRHPHRTVGGATIGRLIEHAAADLVDGATAVDEIDVRFLTRVRTGPIRATAAALHSTGDATTVRVEITDAGDHDRLVTYGLAVCRNR